MKQKIVILGSTGSIGRNTLEVIANLADQFDVVGLAAGSNIDALAELADRWSPAYVAISDQSRSEQLRAMLPAATKMLTGPNAMVELVEESDCSCVVSAAVGAVGLPATLRAVEMGLKVAVANKETLVVAGAVLVPLAAKTGATLLPIDSEHSAVFQAIQAGRREDVSRIFLTASGGPFWTWTAEQMASATVADALDHPTWQMGPKISIDSATMMNKALEIIEARWLFGMQHDQIDVVVHPESVIHSLVEFCDGSMVAQMGTPDMRMPIQYALTYPRRHPCPVERLCLYSLGKMTFFPPDADRFPSLKLGHEAARRGGTWGAVLNAANERANEMFRLGMIGFSDIVPIIEDVLGEHDHVAEPSLERLLHADEWARAKIDKIAACRKD